MRSCRQSFSLKKDPEGLSRYFSKTRLNGRVALVGVSGLTAHSAKDNGLADGRHGAIWFSASTHCGKANQSVALSSSSALTAAAAIANPLADGPKPKSNGA